MGQNWNSNEKDAKAGSINFANGGCEVGSAIETLAMMFAVAAAVEASVARALKVAEIFMLVLTGVNLGCPRYH